jgi:Protein of unknown function (DUF3631)
MKTAISMDESLEDLDAYKPFNELDARASDAKLDKIAKMSPIEYGRQRKGLAEELGLDSVKFLDEERDARRKKANEGDDAGMLPPDPEPWPGPVDGAELLDDIADSARSYLVLPNGGAETIALWSLFAHAHDCFEISPVLAATSPTPECGRTTLLTLLGELVPQPLPASNITASALFRAIDKWGPTVLVDEADTFLRENDELRGILNSGHNRRSAWIIRAQGEEHEPRRFSTWAPKAVALIGKLHPTLSSRSIPLPMQRKLPSEKVGRLRADQLTHLLPLRRRAARWALYHGMKLRAIDPVLPYALDGRAADNWRPLLAIADLVGAQWPKTARAIAEVSAVSAKDETAAIMLLSDIKDIFTARAVDELQSEDIIAELIKLEGRPWAEWGRNDKPITKNQLAKLLKGFEVEPKQVWSGSKNKNGYALPPLETAFSRYLSSKTLDPVENKELRGVQTLEKAPKKRRV